MHIHDPKLFAQQQQHHHRRHQHPANVFIYAYVYTIYCIITNRKLKLIENYMLKCTFIYALYTNTMYAMHLASIISAFMYVCVVNEQFQLMQHKFVFVKAFSDFYSFHYFFLFKNLHSFVNRNKFFLQNVHLLISCII